MLEDVLTNIYNKSNSTKTSPLDNLFPLETSTIGEKEIRDLLQKLDLDDNKFVTRRELALFFKENKDWISKPFEERVS